MKIEDFENTDGSTSTLATFTIFWDAAHVRFRKVKLIRSKAGKLFISFPSTKIGDAFVSLVEFTEDQRFPFQNKVLTLLEHFLK